MSSTPSTAGHGAPHVHRDYQGAKIGMWLFLFTEVLLFAGLFLAFLVYRSTHLEAFHHAAQALNVTLGGTNTVVLLTSSLTMVLSITAIQKGEKRASLFFLGVTILCAVIFTCIKYVEWSAKIHHGIYPGSPHLAEMPRGEVLFYGLYYTMTGLHALHVFIGAGTLIGMIPLISNGNINKGDFIKLENAGLYWHLVDLIWIYLFPLLYLVK